MQNNQAFCKRNCRSLYFCETLSYFPCKCSWQWSWTPRNIFAATNFKSFRQIYRIFWKLRDFDITVSTLFWRQVASLYKIAQCSAYVPQIINPRQWILTWRQQRGTATAFLCWTSIQSSWRNTEIAGILFSWLCGCLTLLILSSHLIKKQRDPR